MNRLPTKEHLSRNVSICAATEVKLGFVINAIMRIRNQPNRRPCGTGSGFENKREWYCDGGRGGLWGDAKWSRDDGGQVHIVLGVACREGMVGKSKTKGGILYRDGGGMGVYMN